MKWVITDGNGYYNGWGIGYGYDESAYLFESKKEAKRVLKRLQKTAGWDCLYVKKIKEAKDV